MRRPLGAHHKLSQNAQLVLRRNREESVERIGDTGWGGTPGSSESVQVPVLGSKPRQRKVSSLQDASSSEKSLNVFGSTKSPE